MASEEYAALLQLGPFKGLDSTKAGPSVEPGHAVASTNANPTIIEDALTCERGRVNAADFAGLLASITVVFPFAVTDNAVNAPVPGYVVGGLNGAGAFVGYYYYPRTGSKYAITGLATFDQAVQFQSVIYTNAGQRLVTEPTGSVASLIAYQWQYPAPQVRQALGAGMTIADAGAGLMGAGQYFYVVTRTTLGPDGNTNETSVDLAQFAAPLTITIAASHNITVALAHGFTFTGTNADGSTYTTNLYRQSTNQPTYTFVANLAANAPYTDTQTDAQIVGNQQLVPQRDQPPVSPTPYGTSAGTHNYGALAIHKNRIWVYVIVASTGALGVTYQVQLWYSNLGRGWEFNQLTQALLLNSDVTTSISATFAPQTYADPYGNEPVALAEVGSILLAFSRRQTWAVYGDAANSFVPRQIFNIGCVSRHAVTTANGGVFWLSENGAYFFDGSAPQYISEGIRGALRATPLSPAPSPRDQGQACGFFSNMTWYLAFPTLGYTLPYFVVTGKWLTTLQYAPAATAASAYVAANLNVFSTTGTLGDFNEVVAARSGSPKLDWYFADPNYDLGLPQTVTWNGPLSVSSKPSFEKQFRYLTVHVPPLTRGRAVVTLQIDSQAPFIWTIPDLSLTTRPIKGVGINSGTLRGFTASLAISVTGLAGQEAPQIWNVIAWGQTPPDRNLVSSA